MRRDLAIAMLSMVFALLALVSLSEHRAEQPAIPLVKTSAVEAPQLFAPCPLSKRNFTATKEHRASLSLENET